LFITPVASTNILEWTSIIRFHLNFYLYIYVKLSFLKYVHTMLFSWVVCLPRPHHEIISVYFVSCSVLGFSFLRSDLTKLFHCVYVVQNKMKSLSLLFAYHIYKSKDVQMLLTHCGRGHLNYLNACSRGLNNINQLLYCVSLKIYNKFANYFCIIKCIVCGNQAWFKNADLRHPSCTVVMYKRKSASPVHNVLIIHYFELTGIK
jgi:hypothetical protein